MISNVQDKANEYAAQLQAKIDAVKKSKPSKPRWKERLWLWFAYNDETLVLTSLLCKRACWINLVIPTLQRGHQAWPWKISVSMDPELIIYVTSDRNKIGCQRSRGWWRQMKFWKTFLQLRIKNHDHLLRWVDGLWSSSDWFPWENQWLYQ